ncbi:MAG: hypothetical protein K5795_04260 [Lachnospiraceae bacterium]|nr:hypothetical protein [Lachnospiraceae bacterium]
MVPLTARGRYGLKVKDAEKFLVKLVGSLKQFTSRELTDHFMGPLIAKTNSNIISYMSVNQVIKIIWINEVFMEKNGVSDARIYILIFLISFSGKVAC